MGVYLFLLSSLQYNRTVQQLFIDFKKVYDSVMTEEFHSFLTEFSMCMELITLIKMCLVNSIQVNICLMHLC
jgi:hypothetical protein